MYKINVNYNELVFKSLSMPVWWLAKATFTISLQVCVGDSE